MHKPGLILSTLLCLSAACGSDSSSTADAAAAPDAPSPPDAAVPDAVPPPPPDAAAPDARTYDFSCIGAPSPTTAPTSIAIDGTVTDLLSAANIADVLVEARLRSDDMVQGSGVTDAMGAFSFNAANASGLPMDGYLQFTRTGYTTTYIYPPDPIAGDVTGLAGGMLMGMNITIIYTVSGAAAYDVADGTSLILVMDCAGTAIEGAAIGISPTLSDTAIGYLVGMMPDLSATSTGPSGVAIGFHFPPGLITLTADYMGTPLESHTYGSFADSVSLTIIHP
jgi:hypothetical protein